MSTDRPVNDMENQLIGLVTNNPKLAPTLAKLDLRPLSTLALQRLTNLAFTSGPPELTEDLAVRLLALKLPGDVITSAH